MPAKAPIKRLRFQQLYEQGIPTTKIAEWLRTTHQAVSKLLKLKENPELRQQHVASRTLNRKLSGGNSLPERMPMRVKELYALGLSIKDLSRLLAVPPPNVFMLVDDDAELGRLHAARAALDRKLANREPVTEADFIADQAAPVPDDDGGELARNGAPAAVEEEAAPTEEMQPPDEQPASEQIQPPDDATDERPEVAPVEQPKVEQPPEQPADEQPEVQAAVLQPLEDAPDEHSAEGMQPPEPPRDAPEAATQQPERSSQMLSKRSTKTSTKGETENAAAAVHLVLKHVGAEYGFQPNQLTIQEEPRPQWWPQQSKEEARQVVVFIALRVAGLSPVQLSAVLGCDLSTILHADSEILPIFLADHARRERILGIELRIRQEARLTPSAQP